MNISVDKESSIPIYRQIEAAIKKRVLGGELPYGWKLPSERRLAAIIGVHRNTVIKAYKLLVDQELISSDFEGRKGYFVISGKAEDAGPAQRKTAPAVFSYHTNITACGKIFEDIFEASFNRENISFGGHIAPEEIINLEHIKDVMDKVISIYGKEAFYYCQAKGDIILRKQLALALQEEGINTRAGDVVIINETTHGLEYMANILASEKDYVVSESPIMPDNYSLFLDRGLQVILAPMEEDGVDMAQLENIFRKYHPRFFHTMPDYHGVTGARMSLEKRHALIDLADRYDVPIVEESWCNGIDFDEESLPTLYSLDKRHNVIYMDSALTKFYYGSKIAYILAPTETAQYHWPADKRHSGTYAEAGTADVCRVPQGRIPPRPAAGDGRLLQGKVPQDGDGHGTAPAEGAVMAVAQRRYGHMVQAAQGYKRYETLRGPAQAQGTHLSGQAFLPRRH